MEIEPARDPEEVRTLIEEYAAFLGAEGRLADDLRSEADDRGSRYECVLLARVDGGLAGCGALRRHDEKAAEVKRLYVRPQFRGAGVGRALATALIDEASRRGYRRILLDTLPAMAPAQRLYESLGFAPAQPFAERHEPGARCFALELGARA